MAKYRLSHQADIDLDEIADYLGMFQSGQRG